MRVRSSQVGRVVAKAFSGLLAAIALVATAQAQQPSLVVHVVTNVPDGIVYADDVVLGTAAAGPYQVPVTTQQLRLVPQVAETWSVEPVESQLSGSSGDTVFVSLNLPYTYRIESLPYGAPVYHIRGDERTRLGETPLTLTLDEPLEGQLTIDHKGYERISWSPGHELWNRHVTTLRPAVRAEPAQKVSEVSWQPPRKHRRWIDWTAGAVAAVAGAYSIHQKFQADRLYDAYEESRDPSLRAEIQRYDNRALLGLGVMQAGIGVVAIRFVLR